MRLGHFFRSGYTLLAPTGRPSSGAGTTRLRFHVGRPSPLVLLCASFALCYLLALLYAYTHNFRDPTSVFFDPVRGYDAAYSLQREAEAEHFIAALNTSNSSSGGTEPHSGPASSPSLPPLDPPTLCLAIATIQRPSALYIHKTVGSLLEGLSGAERAALHVVLFIAHSEPAAHAVFGAPWTRAAADTLLAYEAAQLPAVRGWERARDARTKALFDYGLMLRACAATGAPHLALLEGDVLAVRGWFARAVGAAREVDARAGSAAVPGRPNWLYLRLFYTEAYLGWNAEEWPWYLLASGLAFALVTGGLVAARARVPALQRNLPNRLIALISLVFLPLAIGLFFAAGRASVLGGLPPRPRVARMDAFGCCSQGMLFPAGALPALLDALDRRLEGYVDMLMEALASRDRLQRWAVFPSLLQHIGGQSSKGDAVADQRARMIWSFGFELYQRKWSAVA